MSVFRDAFGASGNKFLKIQAEGKSEDELTPDAKG